MEKVDNACEQMINFSAQIIYVGKKMLDNDSIRNDVFLQ